MGICKPVLLFVTMLCAATGVQADDAPAAPPAAPLVVTEQVLADTYARLQKLSQDGLSVRAYPLARALALLEEARREFYLRNRSGLVAAFVASARDLAGALEQDHDAVVPADANDALATLGEPVAPALWQRVEQLRTGPAFACNGDKVARAEVLLLAAGNEQRLLGWRAAVARIAMAEERLDAAEAVTSC